MTAYSSGLRRILALDVNRIGFRVTASFSALGGVGAKVLVLGAVVTLDEETDSFE